MRTQEVLKFYEENKDKHLSLEEIGKEFGITKQYVSVILKKEGISVREHRQQSKINTLKSQLIELSEFIDLDTTSEDISKTLGISKRQVTVLNSHYGIFLYELGLFKKVTFTKDLINTIHNDLGKTQQEVADEFGISLSYVRKQLAYAKEVGEGNYDAFLNLQSYEEVVDNLNEEYYNSLNRLEKINFLGESSKVEREVFKEKMGKPFGYYLIEFLQTDEIVGNSNEDTIYIEDCYNELMN